MFGFLVVVQIVGLVFQEVDGFFKLAQLLESDYSFHAAFEREVEELTGFRIDIFTVFVNVPLSFSVLLFVDLEHGLPEFHVFVFIGEDIDPSAHLLPLPQIDRSFDGERGQLGPIVGVLAGLTHTKLNH